MKNQIVKVQIQKERLPKIPFNSYFGNINEFGVLDISVKALQGGEVFLVPEYVYTKNLYRFAKLSENILNVSEKESKESVNEGEEIAKAGEIKRKKVKDNK